MIDNGYIIAWKARAGCDSGRGRKVYCREEAEALARELNQNYPAFIHEAVRAAASEQVSLATEEVLVAA